MNEKESEIVSIKKSGAKTDDSASLIAENSNLRVGSQLEDDLQRQLEEERRKYDVMENGYRAVKQYLEDGSGFGGSKDLQNEVERVDGNGMK